MPRTSSQVWKFFDKVGEKIVKCRMCDITLSYIGGSTGTMNNHIKFKHPTSTSEKKSSSQQPSLTDFLSRKETKCSPVRAEKISHLVAEMIAKDSLPISVVEGSGFKKLIVFLDPGYAIPSRKAITARIEGMYRDEKSKVKAELDEQKYVALTTDCWTSRSQEGYMTVTAHFIDDEWSHQSVILDTSPVASVASEDGEQHPQRHTTDALSQQLGNVATEWGLADKISAVVHDNASNVKNIEELNGTADVGCAAYTLQLSVNKGLESSRSIQTTIGAVSQLVGHFRCSNIAVEGLRICSGHNKDMC